MKNCDDYEDEEDCGDCDDEDEEDDCGDCDDEDENDYREIHPPEYMKECMCDLCGNLNKGIRVESLDYTETNNECFILCIDCVKIATEVINKGTIK